MQSDDAQAEQVQPANNTAQARAGSAHHQHCPGGRGSAHQQHCPGRRGSAHEHCPDGRANPSWDRYSALFYIGH